MGCFQSLAKVQQQACATSALHNPHETQSQHGHGHGDEVQLHHAGVCLGLGPVRKCRRRQQGGQVTIRPSLPQHACVQCPFARLSWQQAAAYFVAFINVRNVAMC